MTFIDTLCHFVAHPSASAVLERAAVASVCTRSQCLESVDDLVPLRLAAATTGPVAVLPTAVLFAIFVTVFFFFPRHAFHAAGKCEVAR